MSEYVHSCNKVGKLWIVKSESETGSLQITHSKKPSDEELIADYKLMDEKLALAAQVARIGVKHALLELGFCTCEKQVFRGNREHSS